MIRVVTLETFSSAELVLLERWLHQAHVAPWYPYPSRDLEYASRPPRNAGHWLIAVDAEPVGYVRWQHVDRETLDELGLLEVPAHSVDIDILLGDVAPTGKGIGPAALQLVAQRFLPDISVPQLGLTTSVHNSRAQRGFAKAGFVITRQYQPPGLGLCHLMIRDIAHERGTMTVGRELCRSR